LRAEEKVKQAAFMSSTITRGVAQSNFKRDCIIGLLIRVALWTVLKNVAFSSFSDNLDMYRAQEVLPEDGHSYSHPRYFWGALFALSESLLHKQLEAIKTSPYFSLMMDTSTDCSSQGQLLVYVQYLHMTSMGMRVVVEYLCTVPVVVKTGDLLFSLVCKLIECFGFRPEAFIGFCADGGSEFTGKHVGLITRLNDWLASGGHMKLISVHCSAHRAALVMKDQADAADPPTCSGFTLSDLDNILVSVHGLFAHSSKRKATWAAFIKSRCPSLRRSFPIFNKTRWLSRGECFSVLSAALPWLIVFLASVANRPRDWSNAANLLSTLRNANIVAMLFAMSDLIGMMNAFNSFLQANGRTVLEVASRVEELKVWG
jgi:hypothetical protein